jgi:glycosidase
MEKVLKTLEKSVIYEMNVRQITPSGTFDAARAELLRLKKIGVDIVWVMPIQPIGIVGRKGTLGSYYSIKNYTDFNEEFGSRADFERFVSDAHSLGIKVLLDWVANHTSRDHDWLKNPAFYKRRADGSIALRDDWTDVAELDYNSMEMRKEMVAAMKFWLAEMKIDGFRCDMAMLVPVDFWEYAVEELKKVKKDLIMLAEAEETTLMKQAFTIYYAWQMHHVMNDVAQRRAGADSLWNSIEKQQNDFPSDAIPMIFTSNHDENSWNGTEFERMGEQGAEAFAVFSFIVRGIPLIYTGQDTGSHHRLQFFEKDNIERRPRAHHAALYTALCALRRSTPALWTSSQMLKLENSMPQHVFSILRQCQGSEVVGIFNFSSQPAAINLPESIQGEYSVFNSASKLMLKKGQTIELNGWEYKICTKLL